MKNYLKITLVALFALFTLTVTAQDNKQKQKNTAEVTFITDLDCKNCVKKVEANLPFVKGVKDMKVTLDDKSVWIKYDTSKTDKEELKKAIAEIGYKVLGEKEK